MIPSGSFDSIIVGGGFYGARLARMLRERGGRVLLVERESALARTRVAPQPGARSQRLSLSAQHPDVAALAAQLRAISRRVRDCVDQSFTHYYAIAHGSKVTASQFAEFCRRIGAPLSGGAGAGRPTVQLGAHRVGVRGAASARSTP